MSIKFRLTAMQFLQFFIWGAWLISLGGYMGGTLHFEGGQIGAIFATMGIASLIMPGLMGIIADKWINAERLYGTLHLIGAGALIYASTATTYSNMYWAMLLNMLVYMPTLSLANTVSYNALEQYKLDLIKDFPPIRVWGTVGFICAMWAVDLTGFKNSSAQLYVGGASALLLGLCYLLWRKVISWHIPFYYLATVIGENKPSIIAEFEGFGQRHQSISRPTGCQNYAHSHLLDL